MMEKNQNKQKENIQKPEESNNYNQNDLFVMFCNEENGKVLSEEQENTKHDNVILRNYQEKERVNDKKECFVE